MKLQRFEVPGLVHYSYAIAGNGEAAIVDPKRDVDTYLDYASANNLRITRILETHIHADYASGALELARATAAELFLSKHDTGEDFEYAFPHREFGDGDDLRLGDVLVKALYTPGHTPEHIALVLHDLARSPHPLAMLSGDFLFVGSLGRPDLLGEQAKRRLAEQLYDSVKHRIAALPDGVEVHPAHGAGSMCGSGMSDRPQSTLGYERLANSFFAHRDREQFVEHVLSTLLPFPPYYKRMKRVNSAGPKLLGGIPGAEMLSPQAFRDLMQREGAVVIDVRRPESFGGAHIPGALNIGAGAIFAMWAAWVAPYDRPLLLLGDDGIAGVPPALSYKQGRPEAGGTDGACDGARRGLIRVGLDDVRGSLRGGMAAWIEAGFEQSHIPQISVAELRDRQARGAFVLDVRSDGEWQSGHIEGARHVMGGYLAERAEELPKDKPIHVICGSGYRSSIATSVLRRAGFTDVVDVVGGMAAWNRQAFPVVS